MTDKQRQEFRDKWMGEFYDSVTDTWEELEQRFDQMLLAYDKLNGDRLVRLKEFVEADLERATAISDDAFYDGIRIEARSILAEIERLEEGR